MEIIIWDNGSESCPAVRLWTDHIDFEAAKQALLDLSGKDDLEVNDLGDGRYDVENTEECWGATVRDDDLHAALGGYAVNIL